MSDWTGERIREARGQQNWTQAKLAKRLGASLRSVAAWERGESRPQAIWQEKLSTLFGRPPSEEPLLSDATVVELLTEALSRLQRND